MAKIVSLQAENIKRLSVVTIDPKGNVVELTGPNGAGKSSALDAIKMALGGKDEIQWKPIRNGCEAAVISLDLGALKITRRFKLRDDGSTTTSLTVENGEGAIYKSPQSILDALVGSLSFDPLAFTRMKPREQFEALKILVPSVDFDKLDDLDRADYEKRTEINRHANELRAQAEASRPVPGGPKELIDESKLLSDMQDAAEKNAIIERELASREASARVISGIRIAAKDSIQRAANFRQQADNLEAEARLATVSANALELKLDAKPPIAEPIDVGEIRAQIDLARTNNIAVERAVKHHDLYTAAVEQVAASKKLTEAMAQREREKRAAIAAAKLPVDGLGFGEGRLLLNDEPFEQASGAEQLRASIAIAAAMNPKLRVGIVHEGALLDDASWALLVEMADRLDFQIWVETVKSDRPGAVVIEDGHIKGGDI